MKEGSDPWRGIAPSASYYYDPSLAAYGYGGLDFNGARRKNVTRDSTSTLKAWLNEHRKNPYPTKGEKIMLAIITKMTLTQVSTWFANARRRLKKENKMTWEPRNKMDSDDVKDFDEDDECDKANDCRKDVAASSSDENGSSSGIYGPPPPNQETSSSGNLRGCPPPHAGRDVSELRTRCDSDDSDDCGQHLTSGDNSVDGVMQFRTDDVFLNRGGYNFLRHPHVMVNGLTTDRCRSSSNIVDHEHQPLLPTADFTPGDSSSPTMRNLIHSSDDNNKDTKHGSSSGASSNAGHSSGDLNDLTATSNKPKIWSLADTATSKTPPVASSNIPRNDHEVGAGSVADMIGHCGWFSVNPYQVNGSSTFGGYHNHGPTFAPPGASGAGNAIFTNGPSNVAVHGFSPIPPQTDTPPQTPPNMKMANSLALGSCSYGVQNPSAPHLYGGQTSTTTATLANGILPTTAQGKAGSNYPVSQRTAVTARSSRSDILPEDYTTAEQYRAPPIQ